MTAIHSRISTILTAHIKGYTSTHDEVYDSNATCQECGLAWPCDTYVVASVFEELTTPAREWARTEWEDIQKGDHVRFESEPVSVEGRIFQDSQATTPKLRVELYFASPTLSFLKSNRFTPFKETL
jgi:hypothetical protein